jgi:hypothetical protein
MEQGDNLDFLHNYFNENINMQNIDNLINNTYIEKCFNILFNFISVLSILSILQWILKSLYFYFCYDPSLIGIFTNIFTIYNPMCYYLNFLQWKISDSLIIITISIFMNSSRNTLRYFQSNQQHQTQNQTSHNTHNDDGSPPE